MDTDNYNNAFRSYNIDSTLTVSDDSFRLITVMTFIPK